MELKTLIGCNWMIQVSSQQKQRVFDPSPLVSEFVSFSDSPPSFPLAELQIFSEPLCLEGYALKYEKSKGS